jgi:hypothetical protein
MTPLQKIQRATAFLTTLHGTRKIYCLTALLLPFKLFLPLRWSVKETHLTISHSLKRVLFNVNHRIYSNNSTFCDITPCSPLKVNRRFRGICRHHLQIQRISRKRDQIRKLSLSPAFTLFFFWHILRPWRLRRHIPPKPQLTLYYYIPEDRTFRKER